MLLTVIFEDFDAQLICCGTSPCLVYREHYLTCEVTYLPEMKIWQSRLSCLSPRCTSLCLHYCYINSCRFHCCNNGVLLDTDAESANDHTKLERGCIQCIMHRNSFFICKTWK